MKGIKCFGLLLVFSIIFGLSLNASSDVSALKYAYDSFSLYRDLYTNKSNDSLNTGENGELGSRLRITFDSDHSIFDFDFRDSTLNTFTLCDNPSLVDPRVISDSFIESRNQWSIQSGQSFHKYAFNPNNFCSPYISEKGAYSWSFDSLFSSKYNLTTGDSVQLVNLPDVFFDVGDEFYNSGSIKEMTIPLYLDSERFDHISANTQLEWDFGLVQKSANNFPYLSNDFIATLNLQYFDTDPSVSLINTKHEIDISCSIDRNYRFTTYGSDLWEDFLGFNVHCSWTPGSDIYNLHPSIILDGDNSVNPPIFLTYNYSGLYFTGTYLITNNDDTWSGEYANARPTGDNIESSPGYAQLYGEANMGDDGCAFGDFACELSNLFDFSFVNPFSPIFGLFSDNTSCAQIPTISSMIHSRDTQVCPWFPPSVRQLLTPIFGLSSSMLIFGFAMRWLGSSSGNFFEDSSAETLTYSNWYDGGRGFKRTSGSSNRRILK